MDSCLPRLDVLIMERLVPPAWITVVSITFKWCGCMRVLGGVPDDGVVGPLRARVEQLEP